MLSLWCTGAKNNVARWPAGQCERTCAGMGSLCYQRRRQHAMPRCMRATGQRAVGKQGRRGARMSTCMTSALCIGECGAPACPAALCRPRASPSAEVYQALQRSLVRGSAAGRPVARPASIMPGNKQLYGLQARTPCAHAPGLTHVALLIGCCCLPALLPSAAASGCAA